MSFLDGISQSIHCSSFMLFVLNPFFGITVVSQYSSQSLLFNVTNDRLLGCFLEILLFGVSLINGIPESEEVSC